MQIDPIITDAEAAELYAPQEGEADSAHDSAHDFDHVLRVARLGVWIAQAEGADVEIVRLAALLHDLPVPASGDGARAEHHRVAAAFARFLLAVRGLDAARIDNVAHCIEAHRYRDQSVTPQTLEARVLYDADKLDSIGAIGVLRAAAYAARHGHRLWTQPIAQIERIEQNEGAAPPDGPDYTPSHELVFKLRRLLDTLHTETARRLGRERHARMVEFFAGLDSEMIDPEQLPTGDDHRNDYHSDDFHRMGGEAPSPWTHQQR